MASTVLNALAGLVLKEDERLILAAQNGKIGEVRKLVVKANVNYRNKKGYTALHKACEFGHLEVVDFLLGHGADIEIRDDLGSTPLFWACTNSQNFAVVKFLLEQGAQVNIYDKLGYTPLHDAARRGICSYVQLLVKAGADIFARTAFDAKYSEATAEEIALAKKKFDCVEYLQEQREKAEKSGKVPKSSVRPPSAFSGGSSSSKSKKSSYSSEDKRYDSEDEEENSKYSNSNSTAKKTPRYDEDDFSSSPKQGTSTSRYDFEEEQDEYSPPPTKTKTSLGRKKSVSKTAKYAFY